MPRPRAGWSGLGMQSYLVLALWCGGACSIRAQGYTPDAAAQAESLRTSSRGYLELAPYVARRIGVPIGLPAPERASSEVPDLVKAAVDSLVGYDLGRCNRYFELTGRTLVWIPNNHSCPATGYEAPENSGPDRLVSWTTHGNAIVALHVPGAESHLGTYVCPRLYANQSGGFDSLPCLPWDSLVNPTNDAEIQMGSEDQFRKLASPDGAALDRRKLQREIAATRFGRGREYCFVQLHDGSELPYECGWLWVGIQEGLAWESPLPGTIRRIHGVNAGRLDLGRKEGIVLRVQYGTELNAMLKLLDDPGVRFVEPLWIDMEAELDFPGVW